MSTVVLLELLNMRLKELKLIDGTQLSKFLGEALKLPFHRAVPVVFDRVVGAAIQHFGNLSPLASIVLSVLQKQDPLFSFGPGQMLDHRVEVIVPALTALLARAVGHRLCE